ncbi:hypothetical protein [Mastigocoleus testarum]|uniref:hypothetical protein n=1 Tax=Mastigocoleus testarum TaxID=996925 RepID=UPI001F304CD0|nr:hypothetical protein [Mastigocoleus testarum]
MNVFPSLRATAFAKRVLSNQSPKTLRLLSPKRRRYANPTLRSGRNDKSMSYGHAVLTLRKS